jgi:hypothetical protein
MVARKPVQGELLLGSAPDLRPPVDPRTLRTVRVDALEPAADDGRAWFDGVLALATRMARATGSLYPSDLRAAAEADGLTPPAGKAASAWWGSAVAKLVAADWTKEFAPRRNPAPSRNGAAEIYRYLPPAPGGAR